MKKIIIQLFLVIAILISGIILQQKYLIKNTVKINEKDNILDQTKSGNNNVIKTLSYFVEDNVGNNYTINSKNATYANIKSEQVIMTDVIAIINLVDSENLKVTAKNAVYNTTNHNTNFYNGVSINYSHHNIVSDNLNLSFDQKLASVFNNITYQNYDTMILADKIEVDLISKNSKISMFKKLDNIKIINKK
jgi:hypothetical protein